MPAGGRGCLVRRPRNRGGRRCRRPAHGRPGRPRGVDNPAEIAAIDGIDLLCFGLADLSQDIGARNLRTEDQYRRRGRSGPEGHPAPAPAAGECALPLKVPGGAAGTPGWHTGRGPTRTSYCPPRIEGVTGFQVCSFGRCLVGVLPLATSSASRGNLRVLHPTPHGCPPPPGRPPALAQRHLAGPTAVAGPAKGRLVGVAVRNVPAGPVHGQHPQSTPEGAWRGLGGHRPRGGGEQHPLRLRSQPLPGPKQRGLRRNVPLTFPAGRPARRLPQESTADSLAAASISACLLRSNTSSR